MNPEPSEELRQKMIAICFPDKGELQLQQNLALPYSEEDSCQLKMKKIFQQLLIHSKSENKQKISLNFPIQYSLLSFQLMRRVEERENYQKKKQLFCQYLRVWNELADMEANKLTQINDLMFEQMLMLTEKLSLAFEEQSTKTNYCQFVSKENEEYYNCTTCCQKIMNKRSASFCKGCWVEEKHKGHQYDIRSNENVYCECGRREKSLSVAFCAHHNSDKIEVQIDLEVVKQFTAFYDLLMTVYFTIKESKALNKKVETLNKCLQTKLLTEIEKLTKNNAYYSRLVYPLLEKQITVYKNEKQEKRIINLMLDRVWERIIHNITCDIQTKYLFLKQFANKIDDLRPFSMRFRSILIEDINVIKLLSKQNVYLRKNLKEYVLMASIFQEGKELLHGYIKNQISEEINISNLQYFNRQRESECSIKFLKDESAILLLKKLLQILSSKFKQNNNLTSQRNQLLLTVKLIVFLCKGKKQESKNVIDYLKGYDIEEGTLLMVIESSITNLLWNFLFTKDMALQIGFISLLHTMGKTKQRERLKELFWKKLLENQIQRIIQLVYVLICRIGNYDWLQVQLSCSLLHDPAQIQENQKHCQLLFSSYLYEQKSIYLNDIWKLKQDGNLKFKNAGKILNSYCAVVQKDGNQYFEYESQKQFPNPLLKFPNPLYFNRMRRHLGKVKETKLSQKYEIIDEDQKEILQYLFKSEEYYPAIKNKWDEVTKNQPNENFLYFLFVLILSNQLCQGSIHGIDEYIQMVKKDSDYRKKSDSGHLKTIQQMLQIIPVQNEEEEKEKSPMKKKKSKSKRRKRKVSECQIQKKEKPEILKEGEVKCEACCKKVEEKEEVVFPAQIWFKNTLSNALHGIQNKGQVQIQICFHPIHLDCFMKSFNDGPFYCKKCSCKCNFVLPCEQKPENIKLFEKCCNILVTVLIQKYKYYEYENTFIILFKHSLEAFCFDRLLLSKRKNPSDNDAEKQNNSYILSFLTNIYQNSSDEIRKKYQASIEALLEEINSCSHLYLHMQKLMTQCLWDKVMGKQPIIDENNVQRVKEGMRKEDFSVFMGEVSALVGKKIEYEEEIEPQNEENKIKFSLELPKLPEKANQKLVQFIGDGKCKCGKTVTKSLCLLCGEKSCHRCFGDSKHSEEVHMGRCLLLTLPYGQLQTINKRNRVNYSLYINEFRMPFSTRDNCEGEYELSVQKLEKAFEKFTEMD